MISNVTDYRFVTGENIDAEHPHGDLDRITINGQIMPLRSASDMTLRGEDIAFLQEAVCERLQPYRYTRSFSGFSKDLKLGFVTDSKLYYLTGISYAIKELIYASNLQLYSAIFQQWFDGMDGDFEEYDYKEYSKEHFYSGEEPIKRLIDDYFGTFYNTGDMIGEHPPSDTTLRRSRIANYFNDIGRLNYFLLPRGIKFDQAITETQTGNIVEFRTQRYSNGVVDVGYWASCDKVLIRIYADFYDGTNPDTYSHGVAIVPREFSVSTMLDKICQVAGESRSNLYMCSIDGVIESCETTNHTRWD